jgi:predicted alpha/beta hydrolase
MSNEPFYLTTVDGLQLAVTLHTPDERPKAGVIINSATAVKQSYYTHFARYLASQGYLVITYDYRGIGLSAIADSRDKRLSMQAWGEKDLATVINWATSEYSQLSWHCIGHSVGGQIIGFAHNNDQLASVFCVSAQSGYWRHWQRNSRPRMMLMWYAVVPLLARLFGKVPGVFLGGEALPEGPARQWARWGRHKDYLMRDKDQGTKDGFDNVRCDMKFVIISDDVDFAPAAAVKKLAGFYSNARVALKVIETRQTAADFIGHFGFFRKGFEHSLWPTAVEWLELQA